jgi:histidinol-phosphatase (PHP family)
VLTDYHLHLRPDELDASVGRYHTEANAERYRASAGERGIAELGVSEHVYRFKQALAVWDHPLWVSFARDDLDEYCSFVREQTDLRLGIEADFVAGREDRIANLLDASPFDYVVGSVHFLRDGALDSDEYSVWDRAGSVEDVWRRYFQTVGESARSGLFDIIAHPDLVKVWGDPRRRPGGDLRRYYEPAVEGIAEGGVAVEVSTAGLRKPVGEIYPAPAFLEMCVQAGVPVALSSDAHRPQDVGSGYEQALELLAQLGVRELSVFDRRARPLEPLGADDGVDARADTGGAPLAGSGEAGA